MLQYFVSVEAQGIRNSIVIIAVYIAGRGICTEFE